MLNKQLNQLRLVSVLSTYSVLTRLHNSETNEGELIHPLEINGSRF